MNYVDIINKFAEARQYKSYLSIGVDNIADFNRITCPQKVALSESSYAEGVVRLSPDSYFSGPGASSSYDVVLVDGLHLCEQVMRDIANALDHLNDGGIVLVHDCLPSCETHANRVNVSGIWNGDVWRAVSCYFSTSPFRCFTVDTNYGCAIIDTTVSVVPGKGLEKGMMDLSWDDFTKNGRTWMHVVAPDSLDRAIRGEALVAAPAAPVASSAPAKTGRFTMRTPEAQVLGLQDLIQHVGREHMTVIEVGSFSGESASIFLESGKVDRIYCVDPWKPGYDPSDWASGAEALAEAERAFDARFSGDSRVTKVRSTLQEAIAAGVLPEHVDLVYIDADTKYGSVIRDMESACALCDFLSGHDYCFDSVKRAVKNVYGAPNRTFRDNSWVVANPERRVCVAIPVYSNTLTDMEKESLARCLKVLGPRHDIYVFCPDTLDEHVIPDEYRSGVRFMRFDDKYFSNIQAYSNLVGSTDFYEKFTSYTHVLIYQLDGYVFRDDLFERWVKYDYVGAPWCLFCTECSISGISELVGNGGVCLRNVRKCMEVVSSVKDVVHPEDMRVFTARFNPAAARLVKPHCREALEFSLETNPRRAYEFTGKIPSFSHKMHKYDAELLAFFKRETLKAEAEAAREADQTEND